MMLFLCSIIIHVPSSTLLLLCIFQSFKYTSTSPLSAIKLILLPSGFLSHNVFHILLTSTIILSELSQDIGPIHQSCEVAAIKSNIAEAFVADSDP